MIDLVQAGPFTFCPSMFVAAYIEATETSTDATTNSATTNSNKYPGGVDARSSDYSGSPPVAVIDNGLIATTVTGEFTSASRVAGTEATTVTTSNTATKSETANSVILVLTTGSYKAKTNDPQTVVADIFTKVNAYFNSLP